MEDSDRSYTKNPQSLHEISVNSQRKIANTGLSIMFSMITNIYNKKTKGPNLMELFTTTGKLKKVILTTRDIQYVYHR
jgi:hypothetical protein